MWVYKCPIVGVYTVGYFDNHGVWVIDSYHKTASEASRRINYLNGGNGFPFDLKPPGASNDPEKAIPG
jgi:hypothetical protein